MRILYIIYQWLIAVPILLLVTIVTAVLTVVGCALGDDAVWGYYPGRYWARLFCILLFLPVKIEGRELLEAGQSYVFVANHQGAFDIFLIYGYLNRSFKWLMKKSLRKIPFVGLACKSAGHVFVDNSTPQKVKETIEEAEKKLKNGVSVVVFPEGSRTSDGKLHRFKGGAFQLAIDLGLPVVPLTIEGPYKIMRKGTFSIHPHVMKLTIHPPRYPDKNDEHPLGSLKEYAYSMISEQLGENK